MKYHEYRMTKRALLYGLIMITSFSLILFSESAYGKGRYELGGTEHPWADSWSKASRETISLLEGLKTALKVKGVDLTSKPGWVTSIKTDSTTNLSLGIYDRGGTAWGGWGISQEDMLKLIDGNTDTYLTFRAYDRPVGDALQFDLGAQLVINKIRFYPSITKKGNPQEFPKGFEFSSYFLSSFLIYLNDGAPESRTPAGLIWTLYKRITENKKSFVEIKIDPPILTKWVLLNWTLGVGAHIEISEIEVYGQGYVPASTYISDIIDLKEPASWGQLSWEGLPLKPGPGAKVLISTRTGNDEEPNIYFRKTGTGEDETPLTEDGQPIDRTYYTDTAKVPVPARGRVEYDYANWSPWSAPYPFSEKGSAPITSPGPRRYIQIRADFINTETDGGSVKSISFDYSTPPAATELVAEIDPYEVAPANMTTFTYVVKPTLGPRDTGFNSLEILLPVYASPDQVKSVKIGGISEPFTVESFENPYRIVIHFRKIGRVDNAKLIEVKFDCIVLRFGTGFDGSVFDTESDEVKQRVVAGDTLPDLTGNTLSVNTILGGKLIAKAKASPKTFTPNGDNRYDQLKISFDLLQLTKPIPVSIKIYDFSGRIIKTIYPNNKKASENGQYTVLWDGKDDNDKLVPPGIYLYQIYVEADSKHDTKTGSVVVAY